jgi:ribosomal-protein-serine acetyltransferase
MFKLKIDNEIHLELIHPSHAKEVFEIIDGNRELFRQWFLWVDSIKEVEDEEKFIKKCLERYAKSELINCTIFYQNRLVGSVELIIKKGYGTKQGELGYWLDSKAQRKGIMHKATSKMVEIGFELYNLDKIMLKCAVENKKSCNVAKKLKMSHEGRFRDEIMVNGKVMDIDVYAILKKEYRK